MDATEQDFVVETACTLPPGHFADAMTSDGHVVAFWERPNGRVRFGLDGRAEHATFDGIAEMRDKSPGIFCSGDGAHIAYVGMRGGHYFVGRDGTEDPPMEAFSRSVPPVFSHDGAHLAYAAGSGEEFHLVLDGQRASELPVAPIQAVFSPVGSRLAYVELRPVADKDYEVRVVLDGAPGPWFFGMQNKTGVLQFSPDGRRFAYQERNRDLEVRWVVDGVPQQWAADPITNRQALKRLSTRGVAAIEAPVAATFSPDSRRFAYFADVPEKGVAIIEDDVPGPVVKGVCAPMFSPDSRHLAYLARLFDDRVSLVVDGVPGPAWSVRDAGSPAFSSPAFSTDGRHVGVILHREEGGFLRKRSVATLVVDGRVVTELPADDASWKPTFSPDGTHVAWWVLQGPRRHLMVDSNPRDVAGNVESEAVYTPAGRLICVTRTGDGASWTVMTDGRPGPAAQGIATLASALRFYGRDLAPDPDVPFAVSPDGEHVAWIGNFDGGWRPVLDDRVGPAFFGPLVASFRPDGRATWYFQREGEVYRVTA
jgi:dipeptidyl aminopeptidase/acylaminoacyl peptidase